MKLYTWDLWLNPRVSFAHIVPVTLKTIIKNLLQVRSWAMRSEQESCGRSRHHEPHESVFCRSSGQHLRPFTVAHLALTDRAFVLYHCGFPVLCHCFFTLVGSCHGFVLFGIEMKTKRSCGIKNEMFWQQRRMVLHMGVSCTSKIGLRFGTIGVDLRFFRFGSASIKRVRTAQICPSVLPLPQYAQVPVVYFRLRSTIVAIFLNTYV